MAADVVGGALARVRVGRDGEEAVVALELEVAKAAPEAAGAGTECRRSQGSGMGSA